MQVFQLKLLEMNQNYSCYILNHTEQVGMLVEHLSSEKEHV
jgi:hypothetical protein